LVPASLAGASTAALADVLWLEVRIGDLVLDALAHASLSQSDRAISRPLTGDTR